MVKFFKNLMLFRRFSKALKRCDELNAQPHNGGAYIVLNICGRPAIANRAGFRGLRTKGWFRSNLKWADVYGKRVTKESLRLWLS